MNPSNSPTENSVAIDIELSLEDKFLIEGEADHLPPEPVPQSSPDSTISSPAVEASPAETPSQQLVLIDEELMSEIASIPDRFGFKIGDVADLLKIKQYVLRYWEQEFEVLRPKKASNNQRLYTKRDVENAFLIRKLLYRDKFSIEGARQALKEVRQAVRKEKDFNSVVQRIDQLKDQLHDQLRSLVDDIRRTKALFK